MVARTRAIYGRYADLERSFLQLMKKLGDKGLVQRRPYPGSRRKMLYLPTEAGLALNRCHTQYDTRVFGETLALLAERYPDVVLEPEKKRK